MQSDWYSPLNVIYAFFPLFNRQPSMIPVFLLDSPRASKSFKVKLNIFPTLLDNITYTVFSVLWNIHIRDLFL